MNPAAAAVRLYLGVIAEQLGHRGTSAVSGEADTLAVARPAIEDLLGWQAVVTCAGWAIGSLLTATGLGLVVILQRPEWRAWGPVPGLLAALVTLGLVLAPMLRLPARTAQWQVEAITNRQPPTRPLPPLAPALRPVVTEATLRCRARATARPAQVALESRLLAAPGGPATERMRFAAHPGRPGHDGATQGIDPAWPYVT